MIHEKRLHLKVRSKGIGPGGWNCNCCGPAPKTRASYVRMTKKRERKLFSDLIHQELENL